MDQIRKRTKEQMIATIGKEKWDENFRFISLLNKKVKNHSINQHPVVSAFNLCDYSLQEIQTIHMEYRAIVHIFTDALLMAQFLALQVEKTMKPGSKAYARFLLTLNTLDEFGFDYRIGEPCNFRGNAERSHLVLFENLMSDLSISDNDRKLFVPSPVTQKLKEYFLAAYDDYPLLLTLLAIAEEIVMIFSPAMRINTGALGIPVENGYYQVHGVSTDEDNNACDDFHQNDLWLILAQGAGGYDEKRLMSKSMRFIALWEDFWTQDFSQNKIKSMQKIAPKIDEKVASS